MKTTTEAIRMLACGDGQCPDASTSRRAFLQSAGSLGLAAALFGLSADASALPVSLVDGTANGAERRYPVPAVDGVSVDRDAQVIVGRFNGHAYAFALSCPHQNNAVKWLPKDHRFQCTKHDSQYQADGVHTSGRATRNMDRYAIRRESDVLIVNMHQWFQSDKDPTGWAAASVAL